MLDIGTLFSKTLFGLRSWWVNKDIETSLSKMLFRLRSWCANKVQTLGPCSVRCCWERGHGV